MNATSGLSTDNLSYFDYALPDALVARYPLQNRDDSRLLQIDRQSHQLMDNRFSSLPDCLREGDVVIANNAKVIPARLLGRRKGYTGQVELFLLSPCAGTPRQWDVLMRPARRLLPGTDVVFDQAPELNATIVSRTDAGHGRVALSWPDGMTFEQVLDKAGVMPIPPYLNRPAEASDTERYQTVFASTLGAQAAPTAGLHFTPQVIEQLRRKNIQWHEVTLNVSAGTFRPVLDESIANHRMDPEFYTLPADTADAVNKARCEGRRIIAVGTTVLKTIETAALQYPDRLMPHSGWSDLFIRPGFHFQIIDGLITNFHLPRSTLLMLVSAFAGHKLMLKAYQHAIEAQYRFYSYGDCMLLL